MGRHSATTATGGETLERAALFDLVTAGVLDTIGTGALWVATFPEARSASAESPIFDRLLAAAIAVRVLEPLMGAVGRGGDTAPVRAGRRSAVASPRRSAASSVGDSGASPMLVSA